jgi:hypothetical protein
MVARGLAVLQKCEDAHIPEHDLSPVGQGKKALTPGWLRNDRIEIGVVVLKPGAMADGKATRHLSGTDAK